MGRFVEGVLSVLMGVGCLLIRDLMASVVNAMKRSYAQLMSQEKRLQLAKSFSPARDKKS